MLHSIEQLGKSNILKIPRFPGIKEVWEDDKVVTLSTTIYVHNDKGATVDVYLQPVINTFRLTSTRDKARFIEAHLRDCLRVSKYYILTLELRNALPCIDSIAKGDPELLHKLHYMYP